jgi:hypothetical protein
LRESGRRRRRRENEGDGFAVETEIREKIGWKNIGKKRGIGDVWASGKNGENAIAFEMGHWKKGEGFGRFAKDWLSSERGKLLGKIENGWCCYGVIVMRRYGIGEGGDGAQKVDISSL